MATNTLSPRQKMINLMYLVLTALLALNVSKEILNAFKIVGSGIKSSNESIKDRNSGYYQQLEKLVNEDKSEHILSIYELAKKTEATTNFALNYINSIQHELQEKSGVIESENGPDFKKPDDVTTTTRLLADEKKGKGEYLRLQLDSIRRAYLEIIREGNRTVAGTEEYKDYETIYASILPLKLQPEKVEGKGKELKSWAQFNFGHMPVVAGDVILEKMKNDIINTETQVLEYLLNQAKGDIIDFDMLEARVVAPKSYLSAGSEYEADIFISAASTKTKMEVFTGTIDRDFFTGKSKVFTDKNELPFLGDFTSIGVENGKANFKEIAKGIGSKNYEGIIRVAKPNGGYDLYPFFANYEVAPPAGFSVSPTKMNVLYTGVENPIDIAVSGAKSDNDVRVTISNGTITKVGNGKYIAKVNTSGKATVQVNAIINDKQVSFSPMEFRVLNIPEPKVSLCGLSQNKLKKNQILSCQGLVANNSDFIFEANYQIVSFEAIVFNNNSISRATNNGAIFNSDVSNLISNLRKNEMLIFDNIKVKDPSNLVRKISNSIIVETID